MSRVKSDIASVSRNILRREGTPSPDAIGRVHLHLDDFQAADQLKTIRVDLYNYGIDGNLLRSEHKLWLRRQLVPFVREYRYHVKILGRASSTGPSWANRRVSRERVLLLKEYLSLECGLTEAQVPGNELREQADQFASDTEGDNQRDRAVRLELSPGWKTRPDPIATMKVRIGKPGLPLSRDVPFEDFLQPDTNSPMPSLPYDPPRRKYKIRYLGGYGGAFFVGGSYHQFEIVDENGSSKRFKLRAGEMNIGVYYNPEPTVANWAEFTSNAQKLSDFEGRWTGMGSAGVAMHSKTGLSILGADPVELDTGVGLSAGPAPVSGSVGSLEAD